MKQVSVKTNKRHSVELIPPDDDFWRLDDYVKVFGPVDQAKKRKHKVTIAYEFDCGTTT